MYCHSCGKQNPDGNDYCNGCGVRITTMPVRPPARESKPVPPWVIILGVVIFLCVVISALGNHRTRLGGTADNDATGTTATTPEPGIEITAVDLVNAYDSNEVNADDLYKGKYLIITGTVDSINNSISGDPYVVLRGENSEYSFRNLTCRFTDADTDALKSLTKGQILTIGGTGDGKMMSVQVNDCQILKGGGIRFKTDQSQGS